MIRAMTHCNAASALGFHFRNARRLRSGSHAVPIVERRDPAGADLIEMSLNGSK
jgi:hypothetical protein